MDSSRAARGGWTTLSWAALLLGLVWLAGTGRFLFDVEDTRYVVAQDDGFGWRHSCFSAYAVGAHLAANEPRALYDKARYKDPDPPTPLHLENDGRLEVDTYHYPPPFLVVPHLLASAVGGFAAQRAAWFVLNAAALLAALYALARWAGALRGRPGLLAWPLLLLAPSVHLALQLGNAHVLVVAVALLGMLLFEEPGAEARPAARTPAAHATRAGLGGALLGLAVVTKLWPLVLVLFLIAQRRWAAVLWTAVGCAGWSVLSLAWFGPAPWQAFFAQELPRLASGEAFGFLSSAQRPRLWNLSIAGIPHKLRALELFGGRLPLLSPWLTLPWAALVACAPFFVTRRRAAGPARGDSERAGRARTWLALLVLAQLQSPFLPWVYGVLTTLMLLLFLSAEARGARLALWLAAFLFFSVNVPVAFLEDAAKLQLAFTLVGTLASVGLALRVLLVERVSSGGSEGAGAAGAPIPPPPAARPRATPAA